MSAPLHPKFGTAIVDGKCFWCGEPHGPTALLSAITGETSLAPCNACAAKMHSGVSIIECVMEQPHDNAAWPTLQPGAWPTGRWAVLDKNCGFVHDLTPEYREMVDRTGRLYMQPMYFEQLNLHLPFKAPEAANDPHHHQPPSTLQ